MVGGVELYVMLAYATKSCYEIAQLCGCSYVHSAAPDRIIPVVFWLRLDFHGSASASLGIHYPLAGVHLGVFSPNAGDDRCSARW